MTTRRWTSADRECRERETASGPPQGAHCALCLRCAKSRLFSTPGSHGPQGPEFCTVQPLLVHQGFSLFSLMLAMGPGVLNSAPPMLF